MSRVLFGTDGIRGKANEHPMTAEVIYLLGRALGYRLRELSQQERERPVVVIGKDTRLSGYLIESALVSGLSSVGVDAYLVGPLPTPGVAFLTVSRRADAGVMISASHNPFYDNGVKIFSRDGYKLPDKVEEELEALMYSEELDQFRPTNTALGRAYRIADAVGRYNVYAKSAFPRDLTLSGLKIAVDCAHGASYKVAPEVLRELGAEVISIGVSPDGTNINDRCGATYPRYLASKVLSEGADVGISLDGDADRCIMIDERGQVMDGDQVLAVLARALHSDGKLEHGKVVTTVMSNLGLEEALQSHGIAVERVQVGDRYVMERMRAEGLSLGGEQSGHTILHEFATTGDGLVTSLVLLGVAVREGKKMSELASEMRHLPQALKSFKVPCKVPIEELDDVVAEIEQAEVKLEGRGRVLVRYSGTQQMARVMVEGPDQPLVDALTQSISHRLLTSLESYAAD